MNFIKALKGQGFNLEETSGDYLLPHKYMENDPLKPIEEDITSSTPTLEDIERRRKNEEKTIKTRLQNFSTGIHIWENIKRVDIDLMQDAPSNWAYGPVCNASQLISLMASIENIGLINPIILLKHPSYHKLSIISGKSRVLALKNLYSIDPLDKYKYPVCFILDEEKVDEYYLRALMLDLNFSYKTIPQDIFIKMLLERYALMKKSKQFRNDSNIAQTLADEYLLSKSSIYNFLVLKKLSEEVMTLVFEKRITLQIARLLSKVSIDVQKAILENMDYKDLNCVLRMKYITKFNDLKVEKVKDRVERSKELVPDKISFTIEINKDLLEKAVNSLIDIRKYATATLEGKFKLNNIDKYCKVRYDKVNMKFYLDKELIDEKLVQKLEVKEVSALYAK